MKIIISVKWTSLGQEEIVGGAQTKSGYIESAVQPASYERYVNLLVCQRMRIH